MSEGSARMKPLCCAALGFGVWLAGVSAGYAGPFSRAPSPAPDPMAEFYGNTVRISIANVGYYANRYVERDHTYSESGGGGAVKGVWKVEGGKVCFTQTDPSPGETVCNAAAHHDVGEVWLNVDPHTGHIVTVELVSGRR